MTEPKSQKKRVVPLKEYLEKQAAKLTLYCLGGFVGGLGFYLLFNTPIFDDMNKTILNKAGAVLFLLSALFLMVIGSVFFSKAKQIEPVQLLTLDKAEGLPAEETLVRAFTEPTEGQEKVLLRAATGGEETPHEQLLRADTSQTV